MRIGILAIGAFVAGGLVLAMLPGGAKAASLPQLSSAQAMPRALQLVDWRRRYWRRYGVWPTAPAPIVEDDAVIETDDDEVILVPVRPLSCGEFRYWDGTACVDARYNDPYLGPK